MRKEEFVAGEEWAYRRERQLGAPASRVALVAIPKRKGYVKVKVRHLEGELEGMEEFVSAQHLHCRWKEWRKVERDEAKQKTFLDHMAHEEQIEEAVMEAVTEVLRSTGEDLMADERDNYTYLYDIQVPGLERVAKRAGLGDKSWTSWPAFKDREGGLFLPNAELIHLAMAFAKAEPETVNLSIDVEEKELLREGYQFGELFWHRRLLNHKPAWALAREWAADAQGRDHLVEETDRLRRLAREAIYALKDAGEERKAARLMRSLEGK